MFSESYRHSNFLHPKMEKNNILCPAKNHECACICLTASSNTFYSNIFESYCTQNTKILESEGLSGILSRKGNPEDGRTSCIATESVTHLVKTSRLCYWLCIAYFYFENFQAISNIYELTQLTFAKLCCKLSRNAKPQDSMTKSILCDILTQHLNCCEDIM